MRDPLHSRFIVAWMLMQVHCIDSFVYHGYVRAKVRSGSGFSTLGILGRAGSPVSFVEELSDDRFGEIRSKGTVEPMADSRSLCSDCLLRYMHQRRVIHSSSTQSGPLGQNLKLQAFAAEKKRACGRDLSNRNEGLRYCNTSCIFC